MRRTWSGWAGQTILVAMNSLSSTRCARVIDPPVTTCDQNRKFQTQLEIFFNQRYFVITIIVLTKHNYFTIAHRNGNKMINSCRKWLVRTGLVGISLMSDFGIVLLCLITSIKSSVGPSAVSIVSLKCLSSPKNRCGFQNGQRCRALFLLQWYDSSNCGQCLLYLMAQTTTLFLFLTLECSNIDISYWWKYGGRHIVLHADSMDYRHDFLCNCVFHLSTCHWCWMFTYWPSWICMRAVHQNPIPDHNQWYLQEHP